MHIAPIGLAAIALLFAGPLLAQEDPAAPPDIVIGDPLFVPDGLEGGDETVPDNPYYDDRSTAAAVIESLYNAINRMEYLRAFSYFATAGDMAEPEAAQAAFEAFAEGYTDTESVQLLVGAETTEGAAGTVYYTIPVALEATMTDGSIESYAGCYTLSLAQPSVQATPPFRPLAITDAALAPAQGSIDTILPGACAPL
ncbi:hypothetical protein [Pelagibacterium lacus]|uniref:Uncharacterized protein n=1 Tax=Pelagibacterium lacus TaxID=2282655 RepID=A0A369W312_9HYPH|nr:hypothetical protein [Pelagibacterium lacus]RDE08928.1 hypothetical protein DVH29_09260 [Pelagibacterium lacus]